MLPATLSSLGRSLGSARALLVAAVLLPAAFFGVAAWQTYKQAQAEVERDVRRGIEIVRHHALNVFETHELVAARVAEKVQRHEWPDADASELQAFLHAIAEDYPQVHEIWIADASGRVRAANVATARSFSIDDRDYFRALAADDANDELFVGQSVPGRALNEGHFTLARRLNGSQGSFRGVVAVSAHPGYFTDFWERTAKLGHPTQAVALVRSDRSVLARVPTALAQQARLPESSAFAQALGSSFQETYRGRSSVDGLERIYAQARVGRYDAYVVYGLSVRDQIASWRTTMLVYGLVSVFAALSLLYLSIRIGRGARREREAYAVAARTAEQLRAANQELEAFSYSVSHDLRAPLRAIDGFSQAVLEDYGDRLDDEGRDSLHRVRAGAQRLARLIDDILRLSRLGRAEMTVQDVDLSEQARSVADELRVSEPGRNVALSIQPGLHVKGDPTLLRIVLQNLLANAWKFSSRKPRPRIEFGAREEAGERVYYVRDNGAGFDPTYKDRLFAPFQRLHSESEFPGTGIGLATVQRMIARHGGRVWADSVEGEGATFFFTLPGVA